MIATSNYYSYVTSRNSERREIIEKNILRVESIYKSNIFEPIGLRYSLDDIESKIMPDCDVSDSNTYRLSCDKYMYLSYFFLPFREHVANTNYIVTDIHDGINDMHTLLKIMNSTVKNLPKDYDVVVDKFIGDINSYVSKYRGMRSFSILVCKNYSVDEYGKRNPAECGEAFHDENIFNSFKIYSSEFIEISNELYNSYTEIKKILYSQLDQF